VSLQEWLAARHDRCPICLYHVATQGCSCAGLAAKGKGQAIATAARPNDRAKVDAAIRKLAATGREFSSNDARPLHGVSGPVVGAAFTAAARSGLIKRVGYEASTDPGPMRIPSLRGVGPRHDRPVPARPRVRRGRRAGPPHRGGGAMTAPTSRAWRISVATVAALVTVVLVMGLVVQVVTGGGS
jgi:hypothetical protein